MPNLQLKDLKVLMALVDTDILLVQRVDGSVGQISFKALNGCLDFPSLTLGSNLDSPDVMIGDLSGIDFGGYIEVNSNPDVQLISMGFNLGGNPCVQIGIQDILLGDVFGSFNNTVLEVNDRDGFLSFSSRSDSGGIDDPLLFKVKGVYIGDPGEGALYSLISAPLPSEWMPDVPLGCLWVDSNGFVKVNYEPLLEKKPND